AEPLQVRAHQRLQVCVYRDRRGAFVLAIFGKDSVRDRQRHAREFGRERALNLSFVLWPREREEERHGDRLDARALQFAYKLLNLFVFEFFYDRAVRRDALAHAEPQSVRDERRGARPVQIVETAARLPTDDQYVLR